MDPQWPDGVTLVTIRHRPVNTGGRTVIGQVTAEVSERVWGEDGSILPAAGSAPIEPDGSWEITLPAVDSPGLRPQGAAYRLTEHIPGARALWIAPLVHHAPGPVDLADVLTPAPSPGGGITIQTGPATDASMAEIAEDPQSQFHASLSGTIDAVATSAGAMAGAQAAVDTLTSEPGIIDSATAAMTTALADSTVGQIVPEGGVRAVGKGELVVNVRDHGAIGDGSTDDTAAIQAALDTAGDGGTVHFPSGHYRITARLNVTRSITLSGPGRRARIHQTTGGAPGFFVTASDVAFRGLRISGPQFMTGQGQSRGIQFTGSLDARLSDVSVAGCKIDSWASQGIWLEHCDDIEVVGNQIVDINNSGVTAISCSRGVAASNRIRNVVGTGSVYGIALTQGADGPRSSDWTVTGNTVEDVVWEGLDTHGGQRIAFTGNTVRRCHRGIAAVVAPGPSGSSLAPVDVTISGNVVDSGVIDGTADAGIIVAGAGDVGSPEALASATISGNLVRGHSKHNDSASGAVHIFNTLGASISGNTVIEAGYIGICIMHNNTGYSVSGNTVIDPWSDLGVAGSGINVRSTYSTGIISGNTVARGSKVAAGVLVHGVRIQPNDPSVVTTIGPNELAEATYPIHDAGTGANRAKQVAMVTT